MRLFGLAFLVGLLLSGIAEPGETSRWSAPVVLTGEQIVALKGLQPKEVVAFRYTTQWEQIPVQVDERAEVDFVKIYGNFDAAPGTRGLTYKPRSFKTFVYTDPTTHTGADDETTVDPNDEIVFMLRDAGGKAPAPWKDPPNVAAGSGVEVTVTDPLAPGKPVYAYLFRASGNVDPSAGKSYVNYTFKLQSGDYLKTFKTAAGPNPEASTIATRCYTQAFTDRWITNAMAILPPQGTGVNILDMQKYEFMPGLNIRTVKTFSLGEGAFIANKSGPVRAIRSFIGANSGPLTQREYVFYEGREDITTFLRVHSIPGGLSFFDYGPDAKGMKYTNNNNPHGVIIDGVPDTVTAGPLNWEMVQGKQGTLCLVHWMKTDIPNATSTSYYLDEEKTTVPQPTGDTSAFGASGPWYNALLPNTDPAAKGSCNTLEFHQSLFFMASNVPATEAARRHEEQQKPLTVQTGSCGK